MAWMCLKSAWLRSRWVAMAWRKLCVLSFVISKCASHLSCRLTLNEQ